MQSLVLSILLFTPLALFGSDQDLKGGGDGEQPGKPPRGAAAPEPGGDPAPSDASALERWYPYPLQPPFIGDSYEGWDGVDIVYPGSATFQIGHEPAIPSALAILDSPGQEFRPGYFIVHFANPVSREAHLLLDGLSGKLRGPDGRELARWYIPNRALIAFVDSAGAYEQIAGSELVDWIGRYQPAYKLSALIGSTPLESPERLARHSYLLNVDLVPGHDHAGVAGAIRGLGARVVRRVCLPGKKTYDVHYLVVEAPPSRIVDIALLEGVRTIQEAGEGLRVHDLSGG
ncbi:MAG: hypothetical protein ACE5GW_06475, partial [Planctomycetota bacterium]